MNPPPCKETQVNTMHLTMGMYTPLIIYTWMIRRIRAEARLVISLKSGDLAPEHPRQLPTWVTSNRHQGGGMEGQEPPIVADLGPRETASSFTYKYPKLSGR